MSHVGMDLPNDILFSILSVLPVKSLLRFMCVCKLWNSLIKSSAFIHHHHRVNRNDNDKNSYLLYMPDDRCRDNSVCNILHERYTASSYIMHGDLVLPSRRYSAVGVYEGLICMTEKSHNAKHIYIWNPLVGALKHVPPSEMEPPHKYKNVALGFGFAKDDYKIVKIIFNDKWCLHKVEMYSLGANSWRIIECEPAKWRIYDWLCSGVLFEGSIYWLSRTENGHGASTSLLRFDLEEEIFEETALLMHSPFNPDLELIVENGFLVVLRRYHDEGASVKGWVKKESSWIASEEFVLPKNKIYPLIEVSNSGHLVFTARDEADTWTAIQDRKVFAFEYNEISCGWKLKETKISRPRAHDLLRVRETLFLLNEEHKNEYDCSAGAEPKSSTSSEKKDAARKFFNFLRIRCCS